MVSHDAFCLKTPQSTMRAAALQERSGNFMMLGLRRSSVLLLLAMVCIFTCTAKATPPPTPATLLNAAQGGQISFGTVPGATTQAQAMSRMLTNIQRTCGEKPQIGRVFQFKGTNTVGVFFSVTDHTKGNKKLAGMVLSALSGPRQVDAAQLSNDAQRIGKSVNPMLQQLFDAWHPGGWAAASSSASSGEPASGGGATAVGPAQLHTVTLPDRSASVGIPDGWKVDGGGGTIFTTGPHGEALLLNTVYGALDPRDPQVRQGIQLNRQYGGGRPDTNVYLPYGTNVSQTFVTMFNDAQKKNHNPPMSFQFSNTSQIPGQPCMRLEGTETNSAGGLNNDFFAVFCEQQSQGGSGIWHANLYMALLPKSVAEKEHATAQAMMASFQVNQGVVNAIAAPGIAAIKATGARAAAQMESAEKAHDIQNNAERARQNSNTTHYSNSDDGHLTQAGNNQAFANYLLDQSVVQDNDMYGSGTVGHGTVWNSTADALVKANPNRFEIVDTPNFWQGTDYHQ
jgi:hypothetical protein